MYPTNIIRVTYLEAFGIRLVLPSWWGLWESNGIKQFGFRWILSLGNTAMNTIMWLDFLVSLRVVNIIDYILVLFYQLLQVLLCDVKFSGPARFLKRVFFCDVFLDDAFHVGVR